MNRPVERIAVAEGLLAGSLDRLDRLRLRGSHCAACGETVFGAAEFCPNCGAEGAQPVELSASGIVYTFTVIRHPPPGEYYKRARFEPFAIGLVELPDGVRVLGPLDHDPETLRIGMEVRLKPLILRTDEQGREVVGYAFEGSRNHG